ncbi:MAG: LTA synthase family protein [Arcobacteraceae bacterium]
MNTLITQLFKYYIYMISIFFIGRLALFIVFYEHFKNEDFNYYLTFLYGLRMDTITASAFLIVPVILLTLSPNAIKNIVNTILKYYFLLIISFIIYMEIATFPFIFQYDVRPNYLFVEYLVYPKEVFSMIFEEYKIELIFAVGTISLFIYLYLKNYKDSFLKPFTLSYIKRIAFFIPLIIVLFLGIRSSFGHRGANTSDAMFSTNRMINEITKNSIHSVLYAVYVDTKHGTKNLLKKYGKMDINEAISTVEKSLNIQSIDKTQPLQRFEKSHFPSKNSKNVVIFIQESLGYQFVESLGGAKAITPNLNKLSKEGIFFNDLYSNGTRSIRGLAGLTAGNFSVPGKGVLKRNKSQKDYFTIAKLLKPLGYHTSFIYGGESRFDNMKGWFLGNSFDEVIDREKFTNPSFVGTWGVCDEEVINRANEEYKKLYAKNKKFASVIFSTSNHSPFDFPKEKIELLPNVKEKGVENAIKYADFAIGKFIENAKKEAYYKDTIFVIVADHNVRVYGNSMVPVDMFQIPALILGEDITPLKYKNIATQPDLLATTLDLMGLDVQYPIMGHSIFSDKKQNISLMQFNDYYALRKDNKVAILRPNKEAVTFLYQNKKLNLTQSDEKLEKELLSFIIVLNHLYDKKLYK